MPPGAFRVFGYGSLMWNPDFPHRRVLPARVHGYHRALCLWSWNYRGTRERPGLVLGLDHGGSCVGLVFEVPAAEREAALRCLDAREMINRAYRPVMARARLADGRCVPVLSFVVRRDLAQYAGKLAPEEAVRIIHGARGARGPNRDYVLNTVRHLEEMGCPCPRLRVVAQRLRQGE